MSQIKNFQEQHTKVLQIVGEISSLLKGGQVARDAQQLRQLLSKLAGVINIHLAMEDKSLYPALLTHQNAVVRSTAKKFMDEMGSIRQAFESYMRKWPASTSIQNNPTEFARETANLFNALSKRIARENSELYPLVN